MKRLIIIAFIIALLVTVVYAGLDAKDGLLIGVGSHTPATISALGTLGTITWDNRYIYVCIANNSWMRVELEAWGDSLLLETGDLILDEEGREIKVEK